MTDSERRENARKFYHKWMSPELGQEKKDCHPFWIEIFENIIGADNVTERLVFEKPIGSGSGSTNWIDGYIPETNTLIEQKSRGIALDKPQGGHGGKTPYEQAKDYDNSLPFGERARWIVLSNFDEIWIYDMNLVDPNKPEPQAKLALIDLQAKYHMLDFLVVKETKAITDEMAVSLQAGELVGKIYDALRKQYKNPDDPQTLISLNKLCVRIVFCLYAEDALVFSDRKKNIFHEYMAQFTPTQARVGLRNLFGVLNQKPEERDPYLADDDPLLASFPYVNGGLFEDDNIEIPPLTEEIMDLLLRRASDEFDWSDISPTIFGAVFESTLNPETRRSGGMHYTSIENIHKVIDPLFLDDLKKELEEIKGISVEKTRDKRLRDFQEKLTTVVCLDPAAGSGNFLTEAFLSIRKLENEAIGLLQHGQMGMADRTVTPIKVSISQFYGIEINDFAVTVAKTALWIAEIQMMRQTAGILNMEPVYLPLKTNANIVEGNALRIDWETVVPKDKLRYIMGNPPFVGKKEQTKQQKADLLDSFGEKYKGVGNLDYVSAWYIKATNLIIGTNIKAAFVSTNSIIQGEQAPVLWKILFEKGIVINFAYRTFRWDSEATLKAHVHCVIIGFSTTHLEKNGKIYYPDGQFKLADNICPYLVDAPTVFISNRSKPIDFVAEMQYGSMPIDDGHLILSEEEVNTLLEERIENKKLIRRYVGGEELLNNKVRYCLWLKNIPPSEIKKSKLIMERIHMTEQFRRTSNRPQTIALADTPALFGEIRQPVTTMLVIPKVSSETRRYIPICYVKPEIIVNGSALIIPDSSYFLFGVLTSNVHMSWMRTVAGRLETRYQYSGKIVYNNFPWPDPTPVQKEKIEQTAQGILDARALYPDSSLADLYDPLTMPPELLKAHQANDRAVMQAYGMPIKETDEAACVAWLMRLYQEKTGETKEAKVP